MGKESFRPGSPSVGAEALPNLDTRPATSEHPVMKPRAKVAPPSWLLEELKEYPRPEIDQHFLLRLAEVHLMSEAVRQAALQAIRAKLIVPFAQSEDPRDFRHALELSDILDDPQQVLLAVKGIVANKRDPRLEDLISIDITP